jgi:EryCIII-like glycosyltransferase
MATGKVDPADLGPLPANVRADRTQPQLDVLAHAAVFVTHAGMGSASESLWFGVPTVAVPQAVDQFTNAEQLRAAGAGVTLPAEEVTAEALRAAVAGAHARGARARELRDEVRRGGGVGGSADAVERLAARRRAQGRPLRPRRSRSACSVDQNASSSHGTSSGVKARTSGASGVGRGSPASVASKTTRTMRSSARE